MRVSLILDAKEDNGLILPICYNYLIQAAIYNNISEQLANFLHDKGFLIGKRAFKLFTFSRLIGRYELDKAKRKIVYSGDFCLQISSPIERFIEELAGTIARKGSIILGDKKVTVKEMIFPPQPKIKGEVEIRTLSPITVYSTLMTHEGKKKTYYYSPYEKEFSKFIDLNAKKKYTILKGKNIKSNIKIDPLKVREVIVLYKGTVVRGWMGTFCLSGSTSLINVVYDAGIGAKNSQGFGMFEVVKC
ncbi:MAG: CRISPR-associated endoribonuclease Cas6 [Candidatus Verstraetearchaeota archaeon]|nr:CRISPR-associated endoribonuclease Cas6 [Candidatus Verstraetearchaeota archaeon]